VLTSLARARSWLPVAAAVLTLGILVPPAGTYARQYAFAGSLQFVIFAVAAPALLVLGAPGRLPGRPRRRGPGGPSRSRGRPRRSARSHRPGIFRPAAVLVTFIALVIAWRLPVTVTALARDPGLAVAEMVTLLAAGSGVWLELAGSPPPLPGLSRPQRAAMAALAMWVIWALAYITGMSSGTWLTVYRHAAAHGLSAAADQQLTVAVLWAVPALCFAPVIYSMLMTWLHQSDDPEEEPHKTCDPESDSPQLSGWPRAPRGWRSPPA
jgi:cytochrome c oxidase assembly factor CtaG